MKRRAKAIHSINFVFLISVMLVGCGDDDSATEPAEESKSESQISFGGVRDAPDLTLDDYISSELGSGAVFEEFEFNTEEEGTYTITVSWFATGPDFDFVVYDAFDNELGLAESTENPEVLSLVLSAESRYSIEIYDYEEQGAAYTLSLSYDGSSSEAPVDEDNTPDNTSGGVEEVRIYFDESPFHAARGRVTVPPGGTRTKGGVFVVVESPLRDAQYEIRIDNPSDPNMLLGFTVWDKDHRFKAIGRIGFDGSLADWYYSALATFGWAQDYLIIIESDWNSPGGEVDITITLNE